MQLIPWCSVGAGQPDRPRPMFSINCKADIVVELVLPMQRVSTCKPSLLQSTIKQLPEVETSQPTAYRLHGRVTATFHVWKNPENPYSLSPSMEYVLKDFTTFECDQ